MAEDQIDDPLFVVDNSKGGRNGLGYLREWCEIARAIDVATGYFEAGALVALDGHWQKLDGLRILMGDEVTSGTKQTILKAIRQQAERILDASVEAEKVEDPFLDGLPAVVEAIAKKQIECRVYNRTKFHAKAYITHARLDVVGSQALVGSSNFTKPGLTDNVELNIKIESSSEVTQLQRWYEKHWEEGVDISRDVLRVLERHTAAYSPFMVYARALMELVADREPGSAAWEDQQSRIFPLLDHYQQQGYWALMHIAAQHRGALLCDGVGLGKTFVGLMLIERLVVHDRKRVLLLAPKAVRDAVWEPELRQHLPHVGGFESGADFSNLTVLNNTDLQRSSPTWEQRFENLAEQADVVVIDEAHHFRNRGTGNDDADWVDISRHRRLRRVIEGGGRPKQVFLLTATPINNSLNDYRHLLELFTGGDDTYFSRTLGVPSLEGRMRKILAELKDRVADQDADAADHPAEAQDVLVTDPIFQGLVVQRSRAYVRESQRQQGAAETPFPTRERPRVADYSIRKSYGDLLDLVDRAFAKDKPLFSLPIYYPLAFYTGPDESIRPFDEQRQKQVVGLTRSWTPSAPGASTTTAGPPSKATASLL